MTVREWFRLLAVQGRVWSRERTETASQPWLRRLASRVGLNHGITTALDDDAEPSPEAYPLW